LVHCQMAHRAGTFASLAQLPPHITQTTSVIENPTVAPADGEFMQGTRNSRT
jgi:hypothetical protein